VPELGDVDPAEVRVALATTAARVIKLVRSIEKPEAPAVGNWNAGDVAVHLAHVWENLTALADAKMEAPLQDIETLGSLTEALVTQEGDRTPAALADRIAARAAAFLADSSPLTRDAPSPWLVQGIVVPRVALACHILSECLVHGHDIARAQGVRWTIEPAHASLALMGFAFPLLARLDPRAMVDQQRTAGFEACYELSVRGAGHVFLLISEGAMTVAPQPRRRVDCHVSAAPATLLLLLFGRINQWSAILSGRLLAWGPKPWLGPKLRHVLRNP